jgi:hypothetical protein
LPAQSERAWKAILAARREFHLRAQRSVADGAAMRLGYHRFAAASTEALIDRSGTKLLCSTHPKE